MSRFECYECADFGTIPVGVDLEGGVVKVELIHEEIPCPFCPAGARVKEIRARLAAEGVRS